MNFQTFFISEGLKGLGKLKLPAIQRNDPLKSFKYKMSRGNNRRNLRQTPDSQTPMLAKIRDLKGVGRFIRGLDISNKSVETAKSAPSGLWRISKGQVVDIAKKYKFNVPGPAKPMKHLGSTGIQMIRYKPGVFYLYKPRRHQRRKSHKGVRKMMKGLTFPGL